MHWDRFFDDLEDQLAAQWEAERVALDSEAERLRVARLGLRERLCALAAADAPARFELCDGTGIEARVGAVGADWVSALPGGGSVLLVRTASMVSLGVAGRDLVASAVDGAAPADPLAERVTFGFALRDLARRRVAVAVGTRHGAVLTGTFDRVAADHADLALHDAGAHRRESEIAGFRIVALDAVAWVRVDASAGTALDR